MPQTTYLQSKLNEKKFGVRKHKQPSAKFWEEQKVNNLVSHKGVRMSSEYTHTS